MGREVSFVGTDSGKGYLSNARKSIDLFGPPRVSSGDLIKAVAAWVSRGGRTLGKPTHFSTTDGQFLD
jgi:hypothetical protein